MFHLFTTSSLLYSRAQSPHFYIYPGQGGISGQLKMHMVCYRCKNDKEIKKSKKQLKLTSKLIYLSIYRHHHRLFVCSFIYVFMNYISTYCVSQVWLEGRWALHISHWGHCLRKPHTGDDLLTVIMPKARIMPSNCDVTLLFVYHLSMVISKSDVWAAVNLMICQINTAVFSWAMLTTAINNNDNKNNDHNNTK